MKYYKKKIVWNALENNLSKGNLKILLQLFVAYTLKKYDKMLRSVILSYYSWNCISIKNNEFLKG